MGFSEHALDAHTINGNFCKAEWAYIPIGIQFRGARGSCGAPGIHGKRIVKTAGGHPMNNELPQVTPPTNIVRVHISGKARVLAGAEPASPNIARVMQTGLVNKHGRSRYHDTQNSKDDAKVPEHAAPREQRNRRYDQSNFQEDFGEVKAVGSPSLQIHFML